ncbi:MAG: SMR family transporter [Patescibacteria group bacterium]
MGYLLVTIGAFATIVADYIAKLWSQKPSWLFMITAIVLYGASGSAFVLSLRYGKLTILSAVWTIGVFIVASLMGLLLFHEKLSRTQIVALVFGLISIVLFAVSECGPNDPTCIGRTPPKKTNQRTALHR